MRQRRTEAGGAGSGVAYIHNESGGGRRKSSRGAISFPPLFLAALFVNFLITKSAARAVRGEEGHPRRNLFLSPLSLLSRFHLFYHKECGEGSEEGEGRASEA